MEEQPFDIIQLYPAFQETVQFKGNPRTRFTYVFPAENIDVANSQFRNRDLYAYQDITLLFDSSALETKLASNQNAWFLYLQKELDNGVSYGPASLKILSPALEAMKVIPASLAPRFSLSFTFDPYSPEISSPTPKALDLFCYRDGLEISNYGKAPIYRTTPAIAQFDGENFGVQRTEVNALTKHAMALIIRGSKDSDTTNVTNLSSHNAEIRVTYGDFTLETTIAACNYMVRRNARA